MHIKEAPSCYPFEHRQHARTRTHNVSLQASRETNRATRSLIFCNFLWYSDLLEFLLELALAHSRKALELAQVAIEAWFGAVTHFSDAGIPGKKHLCCCTCMCASMSAQPGERYPSARLIAAT